MKREERTISAMSSCCFPQIDSAGDALIVVGAMHRVGQTILLRICSAISSYVPDKRLKMILGS